MVFDNTREGESRRERDALSPGGGAASRDGQRRGPEGLRETGSACADSLERGSVVEGEREAARR